MEKLIYHDISIIIPTKNGMTFIGETLRRIYTQNVLLSFEIIVIDSGSTDGTIEVIKSFPQIRLIQIKPERFRHGRTRNLGAKEARGKHLVFLNQDAWPADEFWLVNLLKDFDKDEKIAGVFSRQIHREGAPLFVEREMANLFPPLRIIRTNEDYVRALSKRFDLFKSHLKNVLRFSTVSAAIRR